jgi:AcrR family transcriptional regulator
MFRSVNPRYTDELRGASTHSSSYDRVPRPDVRVGRDLGRLKHKSERRQSCAMDRMRMNGCRAPMTSAETPDESASGPRRAEILRLASVLFARQGYQRTSLTDLAQAANVAKATLFHYFATKELILFELYTQAMDVALSRVTTVAGSNDPAVELKEILREHALVILQNQSLFQIFFSEEGGLEPEHRAKVRGQQADYVNLVADRVKMLQGMGLVPENVHTRVAAQSMLGIGSWTYKWFDVDGAIPAKDIAEFAAELALRGLLQPPRR